MPGPHLTSLCCPCQATPGSEAASTKSRPAASGPHSGSRGAERLCLALRAAPQAALLWLQPGPLAKRGEASKGPVPRPSPKQKPLPRDRLLRQSGPRPGRGRLRGVPHQGLRGAWRSRRVHAACQGLGSGRGRPAPPSACAGTARPWSGPPGGKRLGLGQGRPWGWGPGRAAGQAGPPS